MTKVWVFLLGTLLVSSGALILGYHYFGLPGALGVILLGVLGIKWLARSIKNRFLNLGKTLFEAKSKVLRGAEVTVHSVSPAPPPEVNSEDCDEAEPVQEHKPAEPTQFFFLDVTIAPRAGDQCQPFHCWDCWELELVPFDAPPRSFEMVEQDDNDEVRRCEIHYIEPLNEEAEETGKASGEQRIRLHVGVPNEVKHLKFQYYFESFGDVVVP